MSHIVSSAHTGNCERNFTILFMLFSGRLVGRYVSILPLQHLAGHLALRICHDIQLIIQHLVEVEVSCLSTIKISGKLDHHRPKQSRCAVCQTFIISCRCCQMLKKNSHLQIQQFHCWSGLTVYYNLSQCSVLIIFFTVCDVQSCKNKQGIWATTSHSNNYIDIIINKFNNKKKHIINEWMTDWMNYRIYILSVKPEGQAMGVFFGGRSCFHSRNNQRSVVHVRWAYTIVCIYCLWMAGRL